MIAILIARWQMSYLEASRVTLVEYQTYNKAYAIQLEEKNHLSAIQAWFNQSVKATKGSAKNRQPLYRRFEDFYNHQSHFEAIFKAEKMVAKGKQRRSSLAERNRRMNQRRKEAGDGKQ